MTINQYKLFFITRIVVSLLILFLYEAYVKSGISYPDLEAYSGTLNGYPPFYTAVNPLFYALTRWSNYTIDSFLSPHFIVISLIINLTFSSIFIYLSSKLHSYKSSLLFSVIMGAHPYLAIYSLKIDTSLFLIFPIGLFVAGVFLKKWRNLRLLSIALSSLFRNAALPFCWILAMLDIRNLKSKIQLFALVLISYTTYLNFNYGLKYISGEYGCYSFSKISVWFSDLGLNNKLSEVISFFVTPLVHILLDLGSREAIAQNCLQVPLNVAGVSWIHYFSTICFTIFHGYLLFKLIRFVYQNYKTDKQYAELILPLSILLPTLYGAAHMRYLIPLIPMLLLFLFRFKLKNINY